MRLDDRLGDRQAEPQTFLVHGRGAAAAAEALENAFELLRRYADAAIGDAHRDLAAVAADLDLHCSLGFGVAHGIVEKHEEKLPEPCRVAAHHVVRVPLT